MNDRLSGLVAEWLAHPTGILQSLLITSAFFASGLVFGEKSVLFWYLAYCTFVSFATQFTIAYQNRKAEQVLEMALRNMTDLMGLVVALTKEIKGEQSEQAEALDQIEAIVSDLDPDEILSRLRGIAGGVDTPLAPEAP